MRVAPSDPARWHIEPLQGALPLQACPAEVKIFKSGAKTECLDPDTVEQVLARLDTIAMATPRTTRLAGSPTEGRITWITRSRLFGFPDYTTAAATRIEAGTRLNILARLRFGRSDRGVNGARLRDWRTRLAP